MVAHEHGACAAGADARCDPVPILPSAARILLTGTRLTSALMKQAKADTLTTHMRRTSSGPPFRSIAHWPMRHQTRTPSPGQTRLAGRTAQIVTPRQPAAAH